MRRTNIPALRPGEAGLRRFAALVTAVALGLVAASLVLVALEIGRGQYELDQAQIGLAVAIFAVAFPVVGWIVVRRMPTNAVGWVYLGVGFWQALNMFSSGYSNLAFETASGNLPLAPEFSWIAVWAWTPGFTLLCTVGVLLFPDGRLPSRRWWPVVALSIVALTLLAVPEAIATWPYRGVVLEAAALQSEPQLPPGLEVAFALSTVGQIVLLVAMVGAVAGLVTRFRRSMGIERQQLKWFTFAALVDVVLLIVWTANVLDPLQSALSALVFAPALPVAIGVSILRYRLYDIDRIISRTLVYGLLTAVLAGLYAASVGLMQRVSQAATGANSDVAIVLTTLIVVTAFTPIKNGLQRFVDRRFREYRDPATRLREFTDVLVGSVSQLDAPRTLRRFLAVVIEACDLPGGKVTVDRSGASRWSAVEGEQRAGPTDPASIVVVAATVDASTVRMELSPPARTGALSSRDRATIEGALEIVVRELGTSALVPAIAGT
jgi:hypothetical protein